MASFLRSTRFLWPASVVLALLVGLGIGAAAGGSDSGSDDPTPTPTVEEPTDTPVPTSTPEPTSTPKPTATPVPPTATVPPPTNTPRPKPTNTPGPATTFGDGVHRVGIDIAPGTYRNDSSDGCYWERLSGFSGEFEDLITNEFSDAIQIVTISPSDAGFSASGCGTWTRIGD